MLRSILCWYKSSRHRLMYNFKAESVFEVLIVSAISVIHQKHLKCYENVHWSTCEETGLSHLIQLRIKARWSLKTSTNLFVLKV